MLPQLKFLSPLVRYNSTSIRKQASDDTRTFASVFVENWLITQTMSMEINSMRN